MLTDDEMLVIRRVIHHVSLSDTEAAVVLKACRSDQRTHELLVIASDSRDNYRRRCQIAAVILDEQAMVNLDAIAEVIWPDVRKCALQVHDPTQRPTNIV